MFGVLVVTLRLDGIAAERRGTRKRNIVLVVSPVVVRSIRIGARPLLWCVFRRDPPSCWRLLPASSRTISHGFPGPLQSRGGLGFCAQAPKLKALAINGPLDRHA